MRPIRIADSAVDDLERQVPAGLLAAFHRHDLAAALDHLATAESSQLIAHGPGWRLTISGGTVAGFHVFVTQDLVDTRPDALVVYAVDIWLEDFPE